LDGGFIIAGETNSTDGDINKSFGSTDAFLIKILPALAVQPLSSAENNIVVYPTITKKTLNISLPAGYEHADVKLVNMLGERINIAQTQGLARQLNINNAAAGMYLLQIVNADKVNNFRIIYQP